MLEYEWANPSTMMLSGPDDEQSHEPDPTRPRPIFDPIHHQQPMSDHRHLLSPPPLLSTFSNQQFLYQTSNNQFQHSLYDPRSSYLGVGDHNPGTALFPLDQTGSASSYLVVPKTEEICRPLEFTSSRIGLNLGGRTYFSAADDDFVSRLYRRSRGGESCMSNAIAPRCQAEGCNADLNQAKHYHRRHKVCDFHSKASTVLTAGLTQRFCQQCSRFHLLSEFDNGKRSCRKRLADHNRRRRKSHQSHDSPKPPSPDITTTPRSSNESGTQNSSSLTVPPSPPTISLDCFRQRQYQPTASPSSGSSSSSSMFFSCG